MLECRLRREQRRQSAIGEQETIAAQEAIDAQAARVAQAAREQEARDAEQAARDQAAIDQVAMVHLRVKNPPTAKKLHPQAKCVQCRRSGKRRKDTTYICNLCPRQPGLCSTGCFEIFHTSIIQPGPQLDQAAPPRVAQAAPPRAVQAAPPRVAQAAHPRVSQAAPPRAAPQRVSLPPTGSLGVSRPSTSRASRSNKRRRLQEPARVLPSGEYSLPDTDPDDPASTGSSSN